MASIRSLKYNARFMSLAAWAVPLRRRVLALAETPRRREREQILVHMATSIVSDVIVRPGNIDGEFYISPKSHLLRNVLSTGAYEPEVVALLERYLDPSKDFIDVGANIGFYTVFSAKRLTGGRVVAFEPTEGAFQRLLQNLKRNGVESKVIPLRCFASEKKEFVGISVIPGMEEYSSSSGANVAAHGVGFGLKQTVDAVPLDDIVSERGLRPGLIKIDVEGAETRVVRGARQSLRRFSPVLIVECSDGLLRGMGSSSEELLDEAESIGYSAFDPYAATPVTVRSGIEGNLLLIKRSDDRVQHIHP